jgi:teichuronic acid biosynthesis glycosyltransferase TuaG
MVSIIIPNYNSIKTIKCCLDSIKNQTYSNHEVIIIDDRSTDHSIDVIKSYQGLNIILHQNLVNSGPGICRNIGLKLAKGKYIAFLDSDDFWSFNHLESIVSCFESNSDKDFLFSKVLVEKNDFLFNRFQLKEVSRNSLLATTPIVTSSVVIRSHIAKNLSFKDVVYDDLLFWYDCLSICKRAYMVNNYSTYYRITKNSYSSDKLKSSFEVLKMFIFDFKLSILQAFIFFISYIVIGVYKQSLLLIKLDKKCF